MNLRAPVRAVSHMRFYKGEVLIEFRQYADSDATAIVFMAPDYSGERICTATVNITNERGGVTLPPDEIALKGYSENEGVRETLEAAGIIGATPIAVIRLPFVVIPIFKLLPEVE